MKKSKIKIILEDHWDGFLQKYKSKIRFNVKNEVQKVLKCKDTKYEFIELKCNKCNKCNTIKRLDSKDGEEI